MLARPLASLGPFVFLIATALLVPPSARAQGGGTPATAASPGGAAASPAASEPFLRWSEAEARRAVLDARRSGSAGGLLDGRVNDTHRAYRYKVRATLWTPRALRGAVRLAALRDRLGDAEALAMLAAVEARPLQLASIEIDPVEGSGILPRDETRFFLQRPGDEAASVHPVEAPELSALPLFRKFEKRDWAYELLVVAFPRELASGEALAGPAVRALELVVDIAGKVERLTFPIAPDGR